MTTSGFVETTGGRLYFETDGACRFLADGVAGSRLEVFEGAAHMLNLEQAERFTGLVGEFAAALF